LLLADVRCRWLTDVAIIVGRRRGYLTRNASNAACIKGGGALLAARRIVRRVYFAKKNPDDPETMILRSRRDDRPNSGAAISD
jgi:hypothetical protein